MPALFKGILDGEQWWKKASSHAHAPALSSRAARGLIEFLKPTYWASVNDGKQLRRTAYLDGLRGFAAFMVYCLHHEVWAHEQHHMHSFESAFGWNGQRFFIALPFVRNFFSGGHFAVTTFFVISGYVLSAKSLSYIHAGEFTKLGDSVASSLFRRWLRLFLPVIATTFVFMTSLHLFNLKVSILEKAPTYREEVWRWYSEFIDFSFPWRSGGKITFTYNFHTWSIPTEFRGSITVYTSLMAFSRCTRDARLLCQAGLAAYFIWFSDGWFCALFTLGMLLGDLDLLEASNNLPRLFSALRPYKNTIFYGLFIVSLYLGGVPSSNSDISNVRDAYGWRYLSYLKPYSMWDYKWFYLIWASTFLVASVPRIPWLKAFFETRFCQYLGRVSYAIYLVHGPILWVVADRLYAAVGWLRNDHIENIPGWMNLLPLPKWGPLGLEPSFLILQLFLLPLTLWVAEVVTRVFDDPSIRISQRFYTKTLGISEK